MVTINNLLKKSKAKALDSILMLCNLLDVDKVYIYTYGDREVPEHIQEEFIKYTDKIADGYPINYILKEREFMGLDFYLEEGVLIPRPDTETLVEYVVKYIKNNYNNESIKLLDLGIGSGAISLSIASYCKNTYVYGVDISPIAMKVSNINKERFKLDNVSFHQGNLFEAIENLNLEKTFEIIVSNPPYIPKKHIETLDRNVKDFEPMLALDGGEDGLDFYREITKTSKSYLKDNGLLIYEIGFDQGETVKEILISNGFKDVNILNDLQGHNRVVLGFHRI